MPLRIITIRLPDNLLEWLDRYANRRGLSRSQVIKDAIAWYLSNAWGSVEL